MLRFHYINKEDFNIWKVGNKPGGNSAFCVFSNPNLFWTANLLLCNDFHRFCLSLRAWRKASVPGWDTEASWSIGSIILLVQRVVFDTCNGDVSNLTVLNQKRKEKGKVKKIKLWKTRISKNNEVVDVRPGPSPGAKAARFAKYREGQEKEKRKDWL